MNLEVLEVCPKKFCARIKKTQKAQSRNPKIERVSGSHKKRSSHHLSKSRIYHSPDPLIACLFFLVGEVFYK